MSFPIIAVCLAVLAILVIVLAAWIEGAAHGDTAIERRALWLSALGLALSTTSIICAFL